MKTFRYKEIRLFAKGLTASKMQSWDLKPDCDLNEAPPLEPDHLNQVLTCMFARKRLHTISVFSYIMSFIIRYQRHYYKHNRVILVLLEI